MNLGPRIRGSINENSSNRDANNLMLHVKLFFDVCCVYLCIQSGTCVSWCVYIYISMDRCRLLEIDLDQSEGQTVLIMEVRKIHKAKGSKIARRVIYIDERQRNGDD